MTTFFKITKELPTAVHKQSDFQESINRSVKAQKEIEKQKNINLKKLKNRVTI